MTDEGSRAILPGHCPDCGADRNAEVLAEDTLEATDEPSGIWYSSTYSILRCLGCDRRYIRLTQASSEDTDWEDDPETGEPFEAINERVTYWPSPPPPSRTRRSRPEWLYPELSLGFASDDPELSFGLASDYPELAVLLSEVYTALDDDLDILATIGIRTVFDYASQKLGTDLAKTSQKSSKNSLRGTR